MHGEEVVAANWDTLGQGNSTTWAELPGDAMSFDRDIDSEGSVLVLASLPDVRTDAEETNVEFRIVVNNVPVGYANSGSCWRHYSLNTTTCPAINLHGVALNVVPAKENGTNTSDVHATVQYKILTGGGMFIGTAPSPCRGGRG